MKSFVRFLLRLFFGFRTENEAALAAPGPVMLLPNHASWIDWLFLLVCLDDDWRFVTAKEVAEISFVHRFLVINRFTFPIETASPYAVKRMAEFLQNGGKLVLFPEGRLSRTGCLMKLFEGTGFLLFKTNARVITCYLRGVDRLLFSPNPNRKELFPTVTAHFQGPLSPPQLTGLSAIRTRQRLTRWLQDAMMQQHFAVEMSLAPTSVLGEMVRSASRWPANVVLQDVSRKKLTFRRLLAGAAALAERWRVLLTDPSPRIGILLPNANAVPLTLLSLWSVGRVPAIFNFSTGVPTMLACARLAGIKQIITSRLFLERAKLNLQPMADAGIHFLYLEDVRAGITFSARWQALVTAVFRPETLVCPRQRDDAGVILFTSGSEGPPKGVELTIFWPTSAKCG